MTAKGIPAFTDKLGREWSPEAYLNMDIRTTCANVAHQTQFNYLETYDISLIEVSSHMGARPKCAKDQGRIFDTANKSTKYAHWSSSSYGDADGLLGINCRHKFYPFIDGVNTQTYFPYDEEENAKAYKLSKQQRQLERNVRSSKCECTSLDTLGDKDGFEKASVKLKAQEAKLKSFCSDNDLPYQSDRTAVSGYNRSVSAKAVAANKRALRDRVDKVDNSGIINLNGTLTDKQTREWYITQNNKIPELIDKNLSLEEQARQAFDLRNQNKVQARDLMINQQERQRLDVDEPIISFEELIENKMQNKDLTREQAIKDITETAAKTRTSVNKKLGLE